MSQKYIDDQEFIGIDFNNQLLEKGNYENCFFKDCNLSNLRLTQINFIDCQFQNCDFSNAKLTETGIRSIKFDACKLIGLRFDACNTFLFAATFINCRLDFSSFYQMDAQKTNFQSCSLQEVDFSEANLNSVSFKDCDFTKALFNQTNLEKSDFTTARNFSIDPELNKMNKAKFLTNNLQGLLLKYNLIVS